MPTSLSHIANSLINKACSGDIFNHSKRLNCCSGCSCSCSCSCYCGLIQDKGPMMMRDLT